MSNPLSARNLMSSRSNAKQDNTRILSNLSGDSRVVPARAKVAPSHNKILASLTVLMLLTGVAAWSVRNGQHLETTSSDAPTQNAPDLRALALPASSESKAALIENVPDTTDDIRKNGARPQITTSEKPFSALIEGTTQSVKTEKTTTTDQKLIKKNAEKKGTSASQPRNVEDDTDVTLLTALIQSTESSAKRTPLKKP